MAATARRRIWDDEALTPRQYEEAVERLGRPLCWRPHEEAYVYGRPSGNAQFRPADATFAGDQLRS